MAITPPVVPRTSARWRARRALRRAWPIAALYALVFTISVPLCNAFPGGRHCPAGHTPLEPFFFGALMFIPLGAVIIGVCQPCVRDAYGAALVGWLVTLPVAATLFVASQWPPQWHLRTIFLWLASSFAVGSVFGAAAWVERTPPRTGRRR